MYMYVYISDQINIYVYMYMCVYMCTYMCIYILYIERFYIYIDSTIYIERYIL